MNIIKISILSIMEGAEICTQLLLLFTLAMMLPRVTTFVNSWPWSLDPGPWSLVPSPWTLVPRPWSLVPGPWTLDAVCQPPLGRLLMSAEVFSFRSDISIDRQGASFVFSLVFTSQDSWIKTRLRLLTLPRGHALVSGCPTHVHI